MQETTTAAPGPRLGTAAVVAGSAASGIAAYAFQVVGLRALGTEAYAPISVLWTIQYLVLATALFPVEAYVTRAVTTSGAGAGPLGRPLRVIAGWVTATAVLLGAGTALAADALYQGRSGLAVVLAVVVASAGGFVVARGVLAGSGRFAAYAGVTATESLGRLAALVAVVVVGASTAGVAWSLPAGSTLAVGWWLLLGRRRAPRTEPSPGEAPLGGTAGSFLATVVVANAAAQTLLAAGPLVLIPLGAGPAEISIFFVTVTAARVPLVFAFGGLLSRSLPPLTRMARAGDDAGLRRIALLGAAGALALAGAGALAGSAVGPDVVALLFGAASRPDAPFVALTAAGVVLATASLLLNQVLIARGSERRLPAPWLVGLAAAVPVVLLVDGTATIRVSAGFVVGEVVALAGVVAAILTAPPLRGGVAAER
jgi:O-antigen/teichoic acid export membrane protein